MSDLTPMLEEMAARADVTGMLMPSEIRQAGDRSRKRLVLTAVCVVLGTVAAGLVAAVAARDVASVDPAGTPNPTTSSKADDRVGFVGPPPPGTLPTGPATGKIVAAAQFWMATWVYADGRIINYDSGATIDDFRGLVVRQLTPSGVEAMRAYVLDGGPRLVPLTDNGGRLIVRVGGRLMEDLNYTGCVSGGQSRYCPAFSHPEDWLPASAWEDPTFRPFVPHAYQVCLWGSRRVSPGEVLPSQAADILQVSAESESTRETCWVLATSVASELVDIIDEAGPGYVRHEESEVLPFDLTYELPRSGTLGFQPELPHDDDFCWPVGNPC